MTLGLLYPQVECDGSPYCTASPHRHGCFADRGDCDRPSEHRAGQVHAKKVITRCGWFHAAGHVIVQRERKPGSPFTAPVMRLAMEDGDVYAYGIRPLMRLDRKLNRLIRAYSEVSAV